MAKPIESVPTLTKTQAKKLSHYLESVVPNEAARKKLMRDAARAHKTFKKVR